MAVLTHCLNMMAVIFTAIFFCSASTATIPKPDQLLLTRMNAVRKTYRLQPLTIDSRLQAAAVYHDKQMLSSNTFTHGDFRGRMIQFKVAGTILGENLAWNYGAKNVAILIVNAWLKSPEHRTNLLNPRFRRVGIADIVGKYQGYANTNVVTTDFAD